MSEKTNIVECRNVSYGFSRRAVLSEVSFALARSERLALVGPSGCGKSTLLNLIAGLLKPDSGQLTKTVSSNNISFVFQEPSLIPWKSVRDNVSLFRDLIPKPKEESALAQAAARAEPGDKSQDRLTELLEQVNLVDWQHSFPDQLSGGMKMRAALARALYLDPQLLLLDEPFAALDDITRESLQDEIIRLCHLKNMALVLVTHNIEEAALLSDKILVFSSSGRIISEIDLGRHFVDRTSRRDSSALTDVKKIVHGYWNGQEAQQGGIG
jgi:NitT/TauT family transport system ATP-binding protein